MQSVPRGQNTYTVPMVCRNCGHYWTTRLPLGEPVGRITCPNCECFTGRRAWTLVVERRNVCLEAVFTDKRAAEAFWKAAEDGKLVVVYPPTV